MRACNNLPQPNPYVLVFGGCGRLLHALTPPRSAFLYLQFLAQCHPYILLHFYTCILYTAVGLCAYQLLPFSTDVIQLPIPTNVTLWESTPSSVLISVETPAEYETCITNYSVTVNNFECPTLDLVNNSKYTLICSDLDLYAAHYEFNVSARSLWFDQSDGFIKPFVAVGTSKI